MPGSNEGSSKERSGAASVASDDRDYAELHDSHDALRTRIAAALEICARHEWGAIRWEDPLPVPSWIAEVRAALDPAAWDPKAVSAQSSGSPSSSS